MSKSHYSLAKLLKDLQAAEGIIGHKISLHVMEKGSSSSAKKGKGKKKVPKRDAKPKQQQQKPKVGDGKPKGKCYTCGQKGHWKTDALNLRMIKTQVCLIFLSLKHVCWLVPPVPGVWIQEPLIMSAILCRGSRKPDD